MLATVYGDVHDIGKNLVKTILSNNGYTVHDLGKQVPANTIIDKALEYNADAIGLSALLVSTSKQMPLIVNELARRDLNIPVLVGGAAINRRFGRRILFLDDSQEPYLAGVFYCKDAFEGLAVVDQLLDAERHEQFLDEVFDEAYAEVERAPRRRHARSSGVQRTVNAQRPISRSHPSGERASYALDAAGDRAPALAQTGALPTLLGRQEHARRRMAAARSRV